MPLVQIHDLGHYGWPRPAAATTGETGVKGVLRGFARGVVVQGGELGGTPEGVRARGSHCTP